MSAFFSVSPQRIFNSFVYTEKTSNGETEVQQVSTNGACACLCECARVCGLSFVWLNRTLTIGGKLGFIKIELLLSRWP